MPPPLFEIRQALHHSTPAINASNWEALSRKGWRYEINCSLDHVKDSLEIIKDLQKEHGEERVAVGTFFDDDEDVYAPVTQPSWFGVYVRENVEELVEKLKTDLDDLDALEAWLTKEEN